MIVIAAVFCLMVLLLAGGVCLLELALRLLAWVLAALGWALEITLWLTSAAIAASRAVRRRASPRVAVRAAA